MTQYDAQPAKVPALARTWAATVTYRECGVVTEVRTYTVTLDKRGDQLTAEVNGQPATVERAVNLLSGTQVELLHEVIPAPAGLAAHAQAVLW